MNPLLTLLLLAGATPGDLGVVHDEPPPPPPLPDIEPIVRAGSLKGKTVDPKPRVTRWVPPEPVLSAAPIKKTRAERRKGMARTSPEILAVRERRRRQKRARAAGRAR